MQNYRISTDIGIDKNLVIELQNDIDFIEILSLKFSQQDIYRTLCADYGVVCGRITANNGLGLPNARVSIFVPLNEEDENDTVISSLYPFKTVDEKDENGYRYNLLPSRKQHGGHQPTGTFFDQKDILTREEVLEVFEKYYKYTVKTNTSGDFMIWGVPLGTQILHVDIDLSDIGCFSLRPDDFIRKGYGLDDFKSKYEFKSSNDLNSLPQIIGFDKTIEVYPFWGDTNSCEIGISRVDFDISNYGVKIEPKAYFIGSVYSDSDRKLLSKKCVPHDHMGNKCSLVTGSATIEAIRFTDSFDDLNRPILEKYEINEDVDDDGSFIFPLPMNMDYIYTNEFGENVITNDKNKGIPTSACYRFRVTMLNNKGSDKSSLGSYLVPNIREYSNDIDKSYSFSLNWEDYPTNAITNNVIFNNVDGSFIPKDYFYKVTYNKVYTFSSFMGSYFKQKSYLNLLLTPITGFNLFKRASSQPFLGLKEISPKPEDDCENSVVTPPVNWGTMKINFSILLAITINVFERLIYKVFMSAIQILIEPFQKLREIRLIGWAFRAGGIIDVDKRVIEPLQRFGTLKLGLITYPDCDLCNSVDDDEISPSDVPDVSDNLNQLYEMIVDGQIFLTTQYNLTDPDPTNNNFYITTPINPQPNFKYYNVGSDIWDFIYLNPEQYAYKIGVLGYNEPLYLKKYEYDNQSYYYFTLPQFVENDIVNSQVRIEVFDKSKPKSLLNDGSSTESNVINLPVGCAQYNTVYDEDIVRQSYCVEDPTIPYEELDVVYDTQTGYGCNGGKVVVGQIIGKVDNNPCETCKPAIKSGYSEFRNGYYRLIPAANEINRKSNLKAIDEYCRRKLVGKLFCEGIVNYSFIDNWLSGSLYFFPFKSRVRWDNEETLDLNVKKTDYCDDLLYYKVSESDVPVKRFYYKSSKFNGSFVAGSTLGHPTTMVDLGPRDEFIKEICIDPKLDPNCSVSRTIGSSTYQNFKEMLGIYINYRMDVASPAKDGNIYSFFKNDGFNRVPLELKGRVLNGDILQLISINNEAGIDEFDLQNKKYSFYNPTILDPDNYPEFFKQDNSNKYGPLPIKLELDEDDGYRVRVCLNEPGRLTESSQSIPFYYWNKRGTGFGQGNSQSWDYSTIAVQPLQGMTYGYKFNNESSHSYVLFPMTKTYNGEMLVIGNQDNRTTTDFDIEYYNYDQWGDLVLDVSVNNYPHRNYNSQEEGFTFLYITGGDGTVSGSTRGLLYIRIGDSKPSNVDYDSDCWVIKTWDKNVDYVIKPTVTNYDGNKQILSTPFLFYFGLRPGKTAIDKFIERFGPKNYFKTVE